MNNSLDAPAVIVAVPEDAVHELEQQGLAEPLPVVRGATLDFIVTVGMDAAALVTLLQTPDSVRAFSAWVHGRRIRSAESLELSVRRADRRVHLTVDGDIDVKAIADFLEAAFSDRNTLPK